MRERLVELLGDYLYAEQIADHLLENGVIVPPVKLGQTVYKIEHRQGSRVKFVKETTISRIAIDNEGIWLFCTCNPIVKCRLDKLVFLTKEDAEQALKGGVQ